MAIIGQPIDRVDGRLKVTGRAQYAAEFVAPNVVHAVLVQSTIGAGAIIGFDLSAAQSMPGVLAIITPENAPKLAIKGGTPQTTDAPLLQNMDILFNGQHVAVVVADTLERANGAASRMRVRYRSTEPITSMDAVLDQAYVPKHFRNGERPPDSMRGDPDLSFASGAAKVDATYITPMEHHNPMEPHATIARWDGDTLTVWTATQGISGAQSALAAMFGIEPAKVRVICPYVGGGFGCKGSTWPPATLAAMAAKVVGRPVKLVVTRAQMFTSNGYRPGLLSAGCGLIRLVAAIAGAGLDARGQCGDRLGHGDQRVPDASYARVRLRPRRGEWNSVGAVGHTGSWHSYLHGDVADCFGHTGNGCAPHPVRTGRQ